jgi:hypothetical protein
VTVSNKVATAPPSNLAIFDCDLCGKHCLSQAGLGSHRKSHTLSAKPRSTFFSPPDSAPRAEEDETTQEVKKFLNELLGGLTYAVLRNERLQKEQDAKQDGRTKSHVGGAKKRKSYTVGAKAKAIDSHDAFVSKRGSSHGALGATEEEEGLPQGTLGKWLKV